MKKYEKPLGRILTLISNSSSTKVNWIKVIVRSIYIFIFIIKWEKIYNLPLSFKFKLKQSIVTSLILKDIYSKGVLERYFSGAALQRIWDDIYDLGIYNEKELSEVRAQIINGQETQINIAKKLRKVYLDILKIESKTQYTEKLYNLFIDEVNLLVDGYEFENKIRNTRDFNQEIENQYLLHATNSIALKYILIVIAFELVKNKNDFDEFIKAFECANLSAESIRLANDIGGHEKEQIEGKVDLITIREQVNNESAEESINYYLEKIYNNITKFTKENKKLQGNKFFKIINNITLLGVKKYLENQMY